MLSIENEVLNLIQYNMKIGRDPYEEINRKMNISSRCFLKILNSFYKMGFIRRVGFTFNYRSFGKVSALVAMCMDRSKMIAFSNHVKHNIDITHNYLRNHPIYNVWFTIKASSEEMILDRVEHYAKDFGVDDYIVLKSLRTFKLSVKYDLIRRISWSPPQLLNDNPPSIDRFKVNRSSIDKLKNIPLTYRPFKVIADEMGFCEDELIRKLKDMYSEGVITSFGGSLDSRRIGFTHNAMVVFEGDYSTCEYISKNIPEASHVVLRETIHGDWDKNVYFMIHGPDYNIVEKRVDIIMQNLGISHYMKLYSIKNLKEMNSR